jgi:RNA recognition motif-containing protein
MKLFIGNLGSSITAADLLQLFSVHGRVTAVDVPKDKFNTSRGYGYVSMALENEAEQAIRTLNKKHFMQQFISVSKALPERQKINSNF